MNKFLIEFVKFLFFPIYLIICLPILILAKCLNAVIHLSDTISNIKFFAWYDTHIKNYILIDKKFIPNQVKNNDNVTLLKFLKEFEFPLSIIDKKYLKQKKFKVSISSTKKKRCDKIS